jgi:REP element-mobilizing transposase RayT
MRFRGGERRTTTPAPRRVSEPQSLRLLRSCRLLAVPDEHLFSEPAGYFVTLSAYGNRLHGDPRGTVDREHNTFEQPPLEPDPWRQQRERRLMHWPPLTFDRPMRATIEAAFAEVCGFRGWTLHACHCRTNHIHLVVTAAAPTSKVLHDLKAIATRRLREAKLIEGKRPVWAEHGSTVFLWNEEDLFAASNYAVNYQGADLPGSLRPGPWLNARDTEPRSEEPQ